MTTKPTNPEKSESVLSLLGTIIKRSVELPEDVHTLASQVKFLGDELKSVTKTLVAIASAIQQHNVAISELYNIQEIILKKMKLDGSIDTHLPDLTKDKSQKPN